MTNIILKCDGSVTDSLLLTATVRDLHRSLPQTFRTDVRTSFPEVWENNPHITALDEGNPAVSVIECRNDLIQWCNDLPVHRLQGFRDNLGERLGVRIRPTTFRPDIHLSASELDSVAGILGGWEGRYWLLNAGSTRKGTVKAWPIARYQEIIDHYRDKIVFVQIGQAQDLHPDLSGVIDLRGRTSLRELMRLVYAADGILSCPGLLGHLWAAVETRPEQTRSCVLIAGGREPAHWASYPGQQYLDTIGMLPCCKTGGCWRSRVVSLGDGGREDDPDRICINVNGSGPRCLEMISVREVISRIDHWLRVRKLFESRKGAHNHGNPAGLRISRHYSQGNSLTPANAALESRHFIETMEPESPEDAGRGIVICGGGVTYFTNAWVCINMLRHLGCRLPIQLWHLGPEEIDERIKALVAPLDVELVDALEMRQRHPVRRIVGCGVKPYALLYSRFSEVLLLDADNVPVENPEFLFETPEFKQAGAIFWPDFGHLKPDGSIWKLCDVAYCDEPEWETGQVVVDKRRNWKALRLALWYSEHGDFFNDYFGGDKEMFHLAFRRLGMEPAFPSQPVRALHGIFCQHDFQGRRIFQHRVSPKWNLHSHNFHVPGFEHEAECLNFLDELREKWNGARSPVSRLNLDTKSERLKSRIQNVVQSTYDYVRVGHGARPMTFSIDGTVERGAAGCEKYWDIREEGGTLLFEISNDDMVTCRLTETGKGSWQGKWLHFERTIVELRRVEAVRRRKPTPDRPGLNAVSVEKKKIIFRASLSTHNGQGLQAIEIIRGLSRRGYDVLVRPHRLDEAHHPIPLDVRKHIVSRDITDEWELVLGPPEDFKPLTGTKSLVFTKWESTRIEKAIIEKLNQAAQIIVPSQWNASCFDASGIDRPIHVVPLGVRADIFRYVPPIMDGACLFGVAAGSESDKSRDDIDKAIRCFLKAFPDEKNVRLNVKVLFEDEELRSDDERISITNRWLNEEELAKWYAGLTCFISCSQGESWGLMLHEALAVGRPAIGALYGGATEFFSDKIGYPVRFRLAPGQGLYSGLGNRAVLDEASLIQQMRWVFANRQEAANKGRAGSESVLPFSWENSINNLLTVMKNAKMIT